MWKPGQVRRLDLSLVGGIMASSQLPCVHCGQPLSRVNALCDHGPQRRGEAGWVEEQGPPPWRKSLALARGVLLASPLFLLGIGAFVTFFLGSPPIAFRHPALPFVALGATATPLFFAWRVVVDVIDRHRVRRFVAWAAGGEASGSAELLGDRLVRAEGQGVRHERVVLAAIGPSSVGVLGSERKPTSFSLLRAALLGLAAQGQASLRLERRFRWSIPRAGWYAPAAHEARLELLPRQGASDDLPWLEQRLLSTLWALETRQVDAAPDGLTEGATAGDEGGSPYRQAPVAERHPEARWVGLRELLWAFFKAERAQLFHHRWLIERVKEGGGEAGSSSPEWLQLPASHPEIWSLLSPSGLRQVALSRKSI
jgi:hypothetical protein